MYKYSNYLLIQNIAWRLRSYFDGIRNAKADIELKGSPKVLEPSDGYSAAFIAGNNHVVRQHVGISTKSMFKIDSGYETFNLYKARKEAANRDLLNVLPA